MKLFTIIILILLASSCKALLEPTYYEARNIQFADTEFIIPCYYELYLSGTHIVVNSARFEVKSFRHERYLSHYDCYTFTILHQRYSGMMIFYSKDEEMKKLYTLTNIRKTR